MPFNSKQDVTCQIVTLSQVAKSHLFYVDVCFIHELFLTGLFPPGSSGLIYYSVVRVEVLIRCQES